MWSVRELKFRRSVRTVQKCQNSGCACREHQLRQTRHAATAWGASEFEARDHARAFVFMLGWASLVHSELHGGAKNLKI